MAMSEASRHVPPIYSLVLNAIRDLLSVLADRIWNAISMTVSRRPSALRESGISNTNVSPIS